MKLLSLLAVLAVALALGPPGAGAEDLLDEVLKRGVLKVSSDPNYAPQSFLNKKGQMDGFDVDVAKEVARRLGVKVELITPAWEMITAGSWAGRWDLSVGSMTITEDRSKVLHFTPAYYYTPAQFVVHKANTTIRSLGDLEGKTVGVCGGCTYEQYLARSLKLVGESVDYKVGGTKTRTYDTDADAIQDLALGDGVRLDAVLSALPTLVEAIKKGVPIKLLGAPVYYEHLALAVDRRAPKDPTRFVARLGEILQAMHQDGTLSRMAMKWYEVDLSKKQ